MTGKSIILGPEEIKRIQLPFKLSNIKITFVKDCMTNKNITVW